MVSKHFCVYNFVFTWVIFMDFACHIKQNHFKYHRNKRIDWNILASNCFEHETLKNN